MPYIGWLRKGAPLAVKGSPISGIAMPGIALIGVLGLSACSPGDVELNGKIFDAIGVSTSSLGQQKAPKVAERAPLVVPPSLDRLPPPETASASPQDGSFPIDPEQRGAMSATEMQRRQADYCKVHYDRAIALGDHAKASTAKGPLGMCAPSAMSLVGSNPLIQR